MAWNFRLGAYFVLDGRNGIDYFVSGGGNRIGFYVQGGRNGMDVLVRIAKCHWMFFHGGRHCMVG